MPFLNSFFCEKCQHIIVLPFLYSLYSSQLCKYLSILFLNILTLLIISCQWTYFTCPTIISRFIPLYTDANMTTSGELSTTVKTTKDSESVHQLSIVQSPRDLTTAQSVGKLTRIHLFPIKSCAAFEVSIAIRILSHLISCKSHF